MISTPWNDWFWGAAVFSSNKTRQAQKCLPVVPCLLTYCVDADAGSPGEMRITWATVEKPTSPTAYVQIETSFQGFSAYTTSYFQKNPAFDPTADKFFHTARISNLQPSTSYKYYVSSLDAPTAKSETYSFTTQPMSPNGGYNMTYIVYGDMGVINSGNTVAAVTQTIRRNNPHVDFVFHIGGLTSRSSSLPTLSSN
jgi:hypothetical protein